MEKILSNTLFIEPFVISFVNNEGKKGKTEYGIIASDEKNLEIFYLDAKNPQELLEYVKPDKILTTIDSDSDYFEEWRESILGNAGYILNGEWIEIVEAR